MTPVISPWVFYLMSVANAVKFIAFAAGGLAGLSWAIMALFESVEGGLRNFVKESRVVIAIFIVGIMLGVLTPSERVITKMVVAQNVTYERVETATDVVQTVYEDIMDLFAEEESE